MANTKKKAKKLSKNTLLIFKIVGVISFLVFLLFGYFLYRLDVLPSKYLFLILGIFLALGVFSILSIYLFKKPLKIAGMLVSVLLLFICSVGSYYIYHTDEFLNHSFRSGILKQSTTYYVLANSSSGLNGLNDITDSISYLENAYLIDEARNSLLNQKNLPMVPYSDVKSMFQDLKDGKVSSVLTEQTSFNLLLEMKQGFQKSDFQVIYEFTVTVEIQNDTKNQEAGKYMVYIGGNDFTNSLMDFNMIVTINTNNHRVMLTSVPRDYYIPVSGFGGRKDTLSFMGARGIETNRKSLEEFLGMDLNYFIKINTKSLVSVVDAVGGIEYCSDLEYDTTHATILDTYDDSKGQKLHVQKGCQHLNGIQALTVARERLKLPGGDRQRQKNCQQIILAIFKRLISTNTITNYNNILNSLGDLYQTNLPREAISEIIKETIDGAQWQIDNQSLDGTDGNGYVHLSNLTSYVMNPDMTSVEAAKIRIQEVMN